MRSTYTEVGHGEDAYGLRWEVGTDEGILVVSIGGAQADFIEAGSFAEAVARAVTPGHGEHIVTDLNAHRRYGCPTCLQAVTPPSTCPGGC